MHRLSIEKSNASDGVDSFNGEKQTTLLELGAVPFQLGRFHGGGAAERASNAAGSRARETTRQRRRASQSAVGCIDVLDGRNVGIDVRIRRGSAEEKIQEQIFENGKYKSCI